MGYAIRTDSVYGVRAVDGPENCMANETYSEVFVSFTPTTDDLFSALRTARDTRLTATDKYLLPDYPISADDLALVKTYRAALRDLPDQSGAPWDGGGDETPWPVMPTLGA